MSEIKKRGRKKKSDIFNDTQDNEIRIDNDDDDLRQFLKKDKEVNEYSKLEDIDASTLKEIEKLEEQEEQQPEPSNSEYNPLNEPVKQRSYTGGIVTNSNPIINNQVNQNLGERIIEEPLYNNSGSAKLEIDDDLINPNNSNQQQKKSNSNSNNSNNNSNSNSGTMSKEEQDREKKRLQEEENLRELSRKEKKEQVEQTANAILLAYKNYIPVPFIYISTYNEKKLKDLHEKDLIDLDVQIKKDGTTFREYYKEHDAKVEQAFSVTDEEVEALKNPLVRVLMEKEIALTPTQELLFTGGQILAGKVMLAMKFFMEKKSDIEEMKNMHREKMEMDERKIRLEQERMERESQRNTEKAEKTQPKKEEEKIETVEAETYSPTLDDVVEFEDDNDIPD